MDETVSPNGPIHYGYNSDPDNFEHLFGALVDYNNANETPFEPAGEPSRLVTSNSHYGPQVSNGNYPTVMPTYPSPITQPLAHEGRNDFSNFTEQSWQNAAQQGIPYVQHYPDMFDPNQQQYPCISNPDQVFWNGYPQLNTDFGYQQPHAGAGFDYQQPNAGAEDPGLAQQTWPGNPCSRPVYSQDQQNQQNPPFQGLSGAQDGESIHPDPDLLNIPYIFPKSLSLNASGPYHIPCRGCDNSNGFYICPSEQVDEAMPDYTIWQQSGQDVREIKQDSRPICALRINQKKLRRARTDSGGKKVRRSQRLSSKGGRSSPEYLEDDTGSSSDRDQPVMVVKSTRKTKNNAVEGFDPSEVYKQRYETSDWGPDPSRPKFRYDPEDRSGRLVNGVKMSVSDILYFIENNPRNLKLRLGYYPAQSVQRWKNTICLWEGCPVKRVDHGWLQVYFDEYSSETDAGRKDPYSMAGAMHLWCFEQCFDPVQFHDCGLLVPELRQLRHEKKNRMSLSREPKEDVVLDKIYYPWMEKHKGSLLRHLSGPRQHEHSLSHSLIAFHKGCAPGNRGVRLNKNGEVTSYLGHMGSLQALVAKTPDSRNAYGRGLKPIDLQHNAFYPFKPKKKPAARAQQLRSMRSSTARPTSGQYGPPPVTRAHTRAQAASIASPQSAIVCAPTWSDMSPVPNFAVEYGQSHIMAAAQLNLPYQAHAQGVAHSPLQQNQQCARQASPQQASPQQGEYGTPDSLFDSTSQHPSDTGNRTPSTDAANPLPLINGENNPGPDLNHMWGIDPLPGDAGSEMPLDEFQALMDNDLQNFIDEFGVPVDPELESALDAALAPMSPLRLPEEKLEHPPTGESSGDQVDSGF